MSLSLLHSYSQISVVVISKSLIIFKIIKKKGYKVLLGLMENMRDYEGFEQKDEFRPERFLPPLQEQKNRYWNLQPEISF